MNQDRMSLKKQSLDEISILRPFLAMVIIGIHAFSVYNNGWTKPQGFEPNIIYEWIAKLLGNMGVQTFVFISGYLYSYKIRTHSLCVIGGGKNIVISKLKRLWLPSVIFSLIYFVLFKDYHSMGSFIYEIINGCGHMWFLPMLFWCFLFAWSLERLNLGCKIVWPMLVIMSYLSHWCVLPLQLSETLFYMFFFYMGMRCYVYRENLIERKNIISIFILVIMFSITFVFLELIRSDADRMMGRLVRLLSIIVPMMGILIMYLISLGFIKNNKVKDFWKELGKYTMGIYIFQQFIIMAIYYYTPIPQSVGYIILPWLAFIFALIGSFFLSFLFRRTRIGRIIL